MKITKEMMISNGFEEKLVAIPEVSNYYTWYKHKHLTNIKWRDNGQWIYIEVNNDIWNPKKEEDISTMIELLW